MISIAANAAETIYSILAMPPKGKKEPKGPSNKTLQKEKAKIVEDKTFGLKNKNKSKQVQNYVKQVSN